MNRELSCVVATASGTHDRQLHGSYCQERSGIDALNISVSKFRVFSTNQTPTSTISNPMSTTTATQKALVLPAPGKKYIVGETAIPRPGPNDILVKLHAVGLNPVDWKVALPEFASLGLVPEYPFTPGSDGAGVVVEVGTNVSNFKKGDRV